MMTNKGVCGLGFGDEGEEEAMLADMKARWPQADYRENPTRAAKISSRFSMCERHGEISPLHLMGTPWQMKVWEALLSIPSRQDS